MNAYSKNPPPGRLRSRARLLALALIGMATIGQARAAVPVPFFNALARAKYQVFGGDVNGDGAIDLLLKAYRPTAVVMVDDQVTAPIQVKPPSASLVLRSNGSNYQVDLNPSNDMLRSTAWQPASYEMVFGDTRGAGNRELVLRARKDNLPSFVFATGGDGNPRLQQALTTATLGVDVSGPGVTLTLEDRNADGRADLVVLRNGQLTIVEANADGVFVPATVQTTIMSNWTALTAALNRGDRAGALAMISTRSRPVYDQAFEALGADLSSVSRDWTTPRLVDQGPDFVTFYVVDLLDQGGTGHFVTMVLENGQWLVDQF